MTVKDDVNSGALNFFVYGLDTDKFVEGYNKLNSGALNIESFTDTEITGTLNAAENSIIYTSIPYDKGWKVTVDGKEVSENDIVAVGDALLGVRVSAGNHSVKFKYTPRGMVIGLGISVVTALILVAVAILLKKRKHQPQPVAVASGSVVSDTASTEMSDIGNDSAEETPETSIDKPESTESDETE